MRSAPSSSESQKNALDLATPRSEDEQRRLDAHSQKPPERGRFNAQVSPSQRRQNNFWQSLHALSERGGDVGGAVLATRVLVVDTALALHVQLVQCEVAAKVAYEAPVVPAASVVVHEQLAREQLGERGGS
eukprot:6296868-Prymnesium_polylepis.1